MSGVWNVLTVTIGMPPNPDDKFPWENVDKSGTGWCLYYMHMSFTADTPSFSKDVGKDFYKQFTSKVYPVSEQPTLRILLHVLVRSAHHGAQPTNASAHPHGHNHQCAHTTARATSARVGEYESASTRAHATSGRLCMTRRVPAHESVLHGFTHVSARHASICTPYPRVCTSVQSAWPTWAFARPHSPPRSCLHGPRMRPVRMRPHMRIPICTLECRVQGTLTARTGLSSGHVI